MGDYVVHVEHGIAQFQGLKEIVQDGLSVEFMILEFAEQAKLYVPLTRLALFRKYRRPTPAPPGAQQAGLRSSGSRPRLACASHAGYGGRAAEALCRAPYSPCTAFSPDKNSSASSKTHSITGRLTISSLRFAAIKQDMEATLPMDRLLCGDVGYGKTEVAMRAAFKAVQDGKQVAVLTPTTFCASAF